MSPLRYWQLGSGRMAAGLRPVAAAHGYLAGRGPTPGQGSPAALCQAIIVGEVATVLLDPDERRHVIIWLDEQAEQIEDPLLADTIRSLAWQLRAAAERMAQEES